MNQDVKNHLLEFQKNEITEYHIYNRLAARIDDPTNRRVIEEIAEDERRHYDVWKKYTGVDVKPDRWKIWKFYWISRIFGFTFGIKLMEYGEERAVGNYHQFAAQIEEAEGISEDENQHENALIGLLEEERLQYTGSMVLGLNDALVELTGALAGLTLALRNTQLIALSGLITGIAAALSMAASEYLSTKSEETEKDPLKASVYTGIAYIVTVAILISPYLFLQNYFVCLIVTLALAVIIIALFNYYIALTKGVDFKHRFFEMAGLSLGIASVSFGIGFLVRHLLGVEV